MSSLKSVRSSSRETSKKYDFALSYEDKYTIMEALDHYYVTKQYQEMGSCTYCTKICVQKCSVCGAYYCNSECQNKDWSKHKTVCSKYRDSGSDTVSVKSFNAGKNSSNSNNSVPESDCEYLNENYLLSSTNMSPFKTLINYSLKKKKESFNNENDKILNKYLKSNQNSLKKRTGRKQSSNCRSSTPVSDVEKKKINQSKNQIPDGNKKVVKKEIVETKKKENENWNSEPLKGIENFNYKKLRNVPTITTTEPKEVMCTFRESETRHWVIDCNDLLKYAEVQLSLSDSMGSLEKLTPKVGLLCAAKYEGEWNRAEIVSVSPKLSVHFIDFGNTEIINDEVRKLPEDLESLPPFGCLIEFEDGTPNSYKVENLETLNLTVKKTRKAEDGVSCVEIIDGFYGKTKLSGSKTNITSVETKSCRSVFDSFCEKTKGRIFLTKGDGKLRFGSVIPDDISKAISSFRKIVKLNSSNCAAVEREEGDYVLVSDEHGEVQRGKILSKIKPFYYVVLIDTGNMISTETVYGLPDDVKDLLELGGMLTLQDDSIDELKNVEEVAFEITGPMKNEKWPCVVTHSSDEEPCHGFLQKPPEDVEYTSTHVSLKSGCTVVLSGLHSANSFYVRSLEDSVENKMLEINKAVNENASKVQNYTSLPKIGELCCARYEEDKFYYRGKVTKITNNMVMIFFVDFGNIQNTELKNLKPITEDLKKIPFLVKKVTLSQVPSDFISQSGFDYINELIENETNLILTYTDSMRDEVILTEKESQKVVNNFLKKEERKVPSPTADDSIVLTEKNLNYITLTTKTDCSLCVLHVNREEVEKDWTFWATEYNNPNLVYVFGDLNTKITSYCSEVTESYKPRDGEVCLAKYEGAWYRSVCLEKVEDNLFKVLFLDFGNDELVTAESIRKIDPTFVDAPVLAFKCRLQGTEGVTKCPEMVEKVYSFLQMNINSTFEGVKAEEIEENFYSVSISEMDNLLTNKN